MGILAASTIFEVQKCFALIVIDSSPVVFVITRAVSTRWTVMQSNTWRVCIVFASK